MNFFKILQGNKSQSDLALFKHFGLEKWWLSSFDEGERKDIIKEGAVLFDEQEHYNKSSAKILYLLAGYVNTKNTQKYKSLALRILEKAQELSDDFLELFKIKSQLIKIYYERRNDTEEIFNKTVELCNSQINISNEVLKIYRNQAEAMKKINSLSHPGYEKLALIKAEKGEKKQALNLIKQAEKEGWSGEWEKLKDKILE